ncbi:protein BEARSKIN1 [Capsella rubella]|uniref:protein BEARSKIN1 n=1 Tax=Capsella rubella TaxID=81985 RepID=UPI000CD5A6DC|nr:protein BEARSKIN1 [Capsella rubella]
MSMPERSSPAPQRQPPSTRPSFPPGYKYEPNDKNLIETLLGREHYFGENNNSLLKFFIHQANIYESNPEQLSVEYEKGNDTEWFFISERNKKKKGKGGINQKRGGNGGYWHAKVATKDVYDGQGNIIGYKSPLTYYVGKQPNGVKTDWLMHEYWVDHDQSDEEKDYALCKIYKKKKAKEEESEKQKKAHQFWPSQLESYQPQPHHLAYEQLIFQPAPLDPSYQPQPRGLAYQQQQFCQGPVNSSQPQPPRDIEYQQPYQRQPYGFGYEQYLMMTTLEEENGVATQQQHQQQMSLPTPPTQVQDSRSHMVMTGWRKDNSTEEDLLDMSKDDRFFDIDELFNDEEEHDGVATKDQQQQQSTPSFPDQSQASPSDQDWSGSFNGEFYDIDELRNDVKKGHDE